MRVGVHQLAQPAAGVPALGLRQLVDAVDQDQCAAGVQHVIDPAQRHGLGDHAAYVLQELLRLGQVPARVAAQADEQRDAAVPVGPRAVELAAGGADGEPQEQRRLA
jgi:hypothetical protein